MGWLTWMALANWLGGTWLLIPTTIIILAVFVLLKGPAGKEES